MADNVYCTVLGIEVPRLERVREHKEAKPFSLLLVALLERGGPMTLQEVAQRFHEAGIAPFEFALRSLKRCRPGRPPVYKDEDRYALDPHDDELDLWAFRLGLRPPKGATDPDVDPAPPRPEPPPMRGPEEALTVDELREAWTDASLNGWSAQRIAVAVLEAHGHPMAPAEVTRFVEELTGYRPLREEASEYWRRGNAVGITEDGRWALRPGHRAIGGARKAVRDRLATVRKYAGIRSSPAEIRRASEAAERRRQEHAAELAKLRRAIVRTFPSEDPQAGVLVDVATRAVEFFAHDELHRLAGRLQGFDVIAALDVRPVLRGLSFDPGTRQIVDLGPPQKTMRIDRRGRTLKITPTLLCRGSCGISRPLGDPTKLRGYLEGGQRTRLRRRLEADAKSLYWLYHYGRLHGGVRIRWGFLDEVLPVPWKHWDEPSLRDLKKEAAAHGLLLLVVTGSAPGWDDPLSRARVCEAIPTDGYDFVLVDESQTPIFDDDIQVARLLPDDVH